MILELENFITKEECKALIKLIKKENQPSLLAEDTEEAVSSDYRTSSTCYLPHTDKTVQRVLNKIAMTIGCSVERIEDLQGQLYKKGQEFKEHYDWFEGESYKYYCMASGNRTDTLMIYLNEGMEGGETEFQKLGIKYEPVEGKALWWKNIIDGQTNEEVLHSGNPILKGEKYILTAWVRENKWTPERDNINDI